MNFAFANHSCNVIRDQKGIHAYYDVFGSDDMKITAPDFERRDEAKNTCYVFTSVLHFSGRYKTLDFEERKVSKYEGR